jgi:hypothetical protein
MSESSYAPQTPLTERADRGRRDVRVFEEAVLALRGRWPSIATGLCMDANSLFGFRLGHGSPGDYVAFRERAEEALRLLAAVDGPAAVERVKARADRDAHPGTPARRRGRVRRFHAAAGRI